MKRQYLTASTFSCVNRNTVNRYFNLIREIIFKYIEKDKSTKINGEIELDESYFGAKRVRGKKGRGAAGKTIVFGVLKRDDKVYLEIIKNAKREILIPIVQGKILDGSTIYTDGWQHKAGK